MLLLNCDSSEEILLVGFFLFFRSFQSSFRNCQSWPYSQFLYHKICSGKVKERELLPFPLSSLHASQFSLQPRIVAFSLHFSKSNSPLLDPRLRTSESYLPLKVHAIDQPLIFDLTSNYIMGCDCSALSLFLFLSKPSGLATFLQPRNWSCLSALTPRRLWLRVGRALLIGFRPCHFSYPVFQSSITGRC